MVLSNIDIKEAIANGKIKVDPFNPKNIQSASIDITLSNSFAIIDSKKSEDDKVKILDLSEPMPYRNIITDTFILYPRRFVLASSIESVALANDIAAYVEGRSSVGRSGIFVQNAGWIDPGFSGQITLELYNAGSCGIPIHKGMRIGQLVFHEVKTPTDIPYNGKYQFQKGATPSMIFKDLELRVVNSDTEVSNGGHE